MRQHLPVSRARRGVLLAVALMAGAVGTVAAAGDVPALTESGATRILSPDSGAEVGRDFLLSWTGPRSAAYAVVIDQALPAPGAVATAGSNVILVRDATAVRLTLGPRKGGSPSARRHHTVVVVPLDADGRRVGERSAVVQVRSRA